MLFNSGSSQNGVTNDYAEFNYYGISFNSSSSNSISGNNIANNTLDGVYVYASSDNIFFHNSFVDNVLQVSTDGSPNTWDNGYPSGGNYWSDYKARYPSAAEIDSSGIWNAPCVINNTNTDHYPLMQPWSNAFVATYPYLVVRGEDDATYYRFYNIAQQSWTDWSRVPSGATPDSPASVLLANQLQVVVHGMDGTSIWHCSVNLSNGAFSGWELVAGATPSKPTL